MFLVKPLFQCANCFVHSLKKRIHSVLNIMIQIADIKVVLHDMCVDKCISVITHWVGAVMFWGRMLVGGKSLTSVNKEQIHGVGLRDKLRDTVINGSLFQGPITSGNRMAATLPHLSYILIKY